MYLDKYKNLYDAVRIRKPEPTDIRLRLHRNEKVDAWPQSMLKEIYAAIPDFMLQQYPDLSPFYEKLSNFLKVPQANLLVASGIDEPIKSLMLLCCDPGDKIVFTPGYAMYEVYARMFRIEPIAIKYVPDRFTTPAGIIERTPKDAKILFLPNPSQPVENCFSLDQLREIAVYCKKIDILFAVDEAYHFFGAPSAIPLIDEFDNVLVLRTFSKAFGGASLRLGYVIGSERALRPLASYRLAYETNAFAAHVGAALLDRFESHVRPGIDDVCAGRDLLRTKLKELGLPAWGSVGNFVLVDFGDAKRMNVIVSALKAEGTFIRGGLPEPLDSHALVTCGGAATMQRFFDQLSGLLDGR